MQLQQGCGWWRHLSVIVNIKILLYQQITLKNWDFEDIICKEMCRNKQSIKTVKCKMLNTNQSCIKVRKYT